MPIVISKLLPHCGPQIIRLSRAYDINQFNDSLISSKEATVDCVYSNYVTLTTAKEVLAFLIIVTLRWQGNR